jgi:hypothetical protein
MYIKSYIEIINIPRNLAGNIICILRKKKHVMAHNMKVILDGSCEQN